MRKVKSFELGPHKIKVIYKRQVINPETREEVLGYSDPLSNQIYVSTCFKNFPVDSSVQTHTFYHELAHFLLIVMNKGELNNDEGFVDMLGLFLYQYDKSKK